MSYLLVLTTVSKRQEAVRLADILLKNKLAACINISSAVQSRYIWKGKRTVSKEFILFIKSKAAAFPKLKKLILKSHSYENPELIGLPISKGSDSYLKWIDSHVCP